MTKLVPLGSIEHAIRRVLEILGDAGVESAIQEELGFRRSASLIRKCGDPDDSRHHIQMRYAIALDLACIDEVGRPPLLEAYRAMVDKPVPLGRHPTLRAAMLNDVMTLQTSLGELARRARERLVLADTGSDSMTVAERQSIYAAVNVLQDNAEHLKRLLMHHDSALAAQNADDGATGSG